MTQTAAPTFVMPNYSDSRRWRQFLDQALAGLQAQTDANWRLVIVDDHSPRLEDRDYLLSLESSSSGRIKVLLEDAQRGPGACRNAGIRWAAGKGSEFVLFHDADDVSHPRRLEVTRLLFEQEPEVDFVYSTFTVIDEQERAVPVSKLTPSIREILEAHSTTPVFGRNAWIRIGTETGYTSLTSTVAVRINLALSVPFPEVHGSEDPHTWMRMSAAGRGFAYLPAIASLYRIPQDVAGSSDRQRLGNAYYRNKAERDTDGFEQASQIALRRGDIAAEQLPGLKARFLRRLALTMSREGQDTVARELIAEAERTGSPTE